MFELVHRLVFTLAWTGEGWLVARCVDRNVDLTSLRFKLPVVKNTVRLITQIAVIMSLCFG